MNTDNRRPTSHFGKFQTTISATGHEGTDEKIMREVYMYMYMRIFLFIGLGYFKSVESAALQEGD